MFTKKNLLNGVSILFFLAFTVFNVSVNQNHQTKNSTSRLSLIELAAIPHSLAEQGGENQFDGRFCNPSGIPGAHYIECYSISGDFCSEPGVHPEC